MTVAIRCGRCSCYHEDVAGVRSCYNGGKPAVTDAPSLGTVARNGGPSPKQKTFINSLREQLGLPPVGDDVMEAFDQKETRAVIDSLINRVNIAKADGTVKASPTAMRKQIKAADWPTITEGYYAAQNLSAMSPVDFFKVDIPSDGTWKGCLFVKRILGGSADDTPRTERVSQGQAIRWLRVVQGHEANSQAWYGQLMTRCGKCNRQLTDETSRARGIGPDCFARMEA